MVQKGLNKKARIIAEAATTESKALVFIAGGLLRGSEDITGSRTRVLEDLSILLPVLKTIKKYKIYSKITGEKSQLRELLK